MVNNGGSDVSYTAVLCLKELVKGGGWLATLSSPLPEYIKAIVQLQCNIYVLPYISELIKINTTFR